MNDADCSQQLHELAASIRRRNLDAPARMFLDIVTPVAFLASQVIVFIQPFAPRGRWQNYADLLGTETNWARLRGMIDEREC